MFKNIIASMGGIPMETLEAWASRDERIVKLREDEDIVQKACTKWEEKCKAHGVPERYIESIKIRFNEDFKKQLMVSMARGFVEAYFRDGKTEDELLNSQEWLQQMVERAVDELVSVMQEAAESTQIMEMASFIAMILGEAASEVGKDEEDSDDDSDSESSNNKEKVQ